MKNKFDIQDAQYEFPYHHLIDLKPFSSVKIMPWGTEYYSYMKLVVDRILESKAKSVLDLGCGEGKLFVELRRAGYKERLIGFDLSERAILFARAFNYGNGSIFYDKDISEVREKFDVITLIETMEHIPEDKIDEVVKSVFDRLNPEGVVIVTVPSDNFLLQEKHWRHYNISMLQNQMKNFELLEHSFVVRKGWLFRILTKLTRKFSSIKSMERLFFKLFIRFVSKADSHTGKHIFAVFRKK